MSIHPHYHTLLFRNDLAIVIKTVIRLHRYYALTLSFGSNLNKSVDDGFNANKHTLINKLQPDVTATITTQTVQLRDYMNYHNTQIKYKLKEFRPFFIFQN